MAVSLEDSTIDLAAANTAVSQQLLLVRDRVATFVKELQTAQGGPSAKQLDQLRLMMAELKAIESQQKAVQMILEAKKPRTPTTQPNQQLSKQLSRKLSRVPKVASLNDDDEPKPKQQLVVASGALTGFHVAKDLLYMDFSSEDAPPPPPLIRTASEVHRDCPLNYHLKVVEEECEATKRFQWQGSTAGGKYR